MTGGAGGRRCGGGDEGRSEVTERGVEDLGLLSWEGGRRCAYTHGFSYV